MGMPTVGDLMTRHLRTALAETPFKDIVSIMTIGDIADLPVVDPSGHPLGLVSEGDLLAKLEFHDCADIPPLLAGARSRARWRKSAALTAADLMTTPAVTTTATAGVGDAVRQLARHAHALCVIDPSNRLIGLLTRRDALTVFLRGDHAIKADIEQLARRLVQHPHGLTVNVVNGIVTIDGAVVLRSTADRIEHQSKRALGVIHVQNNLTCELDDTVITGL